MNNYHIEVFNEIGTKVDEKSNVPAWTRWEAYISVASSLKSHSKWDAEIELLPCPVCGGEPMACEDEIMNGMDRTYFYDCCNLESTDHRSIDVAMSNWNTAVTNYVSEKKKSE